MLGRLARWLRLLGFDVLYYPSIEDRLLIRIAKEEERTLLTRDTRLIKRRDLQRKTVRYLLLSENDPFKQLKIVLSEFHLKDFSIMSRCGVCNTLLIGISKEALKEVIPEYVYKTSGIFKHCSGCGKNYWDGTHPEKFRKKLSEVLAS